MTRPGNAAAAILALALAFLAGSATAVARASSEKSAPRKPAPRLKTAPAKPADPESRYLGEPISLDLKDADLKDVLRTFAELTKINIAVDPDVKGSVTLRLHDVPWDQALDVIL